MPAVAFTVIGHIIKDTGGEGWATLRAVALRVASHMIKGLLMEFGKIRVVSSAIIEHNGKYFMQRFFDKAADEEFWTPMGGGVNFGELAADAVKREFIEELGIELVVGEQICVLENRYLYNGKRGHEIQYFFRCEFMDKSLYDCDKINYIEPGKEDKYGEWVSPDQVMRPEGIREFL